MEQQAFVLRISPSGIDRVPDALTANQLIIGWSQAPGLLDMNLSWEQFREIISRAYYADEQTLHKAGSAAGHMWRFIHDMNEGDLVVVPYGGNFYVAEVTGQAIYLDDKRSEDTAYRRSVNWLNEMQPIPRSLAKSALISRMKTQGTCAGATDLLSEIEDCLTLMKSGNRPTFKDDLEARLVRETLEELRGGRIDSFGFENLIRELLLRVGAQQAEVIPRSKDKGADVVATFLLAGTFQQVVAVQAKHWQPDPPVGQEVVTQLIAGIEAESANFGMIITSGTISNEATELAESYHQDKGVKIELVDGEQFAKLLVEKGFGESRNIL